MLLYCPHPRPHPRPRPRHRHGNPHLGLLKPGAAAPQKKIVFSKCGSDESSGHGDQFWPKIVKIGAILKG